MVTIHIPTGRKWGIPLRELGGYARRVVYAKLRPHSTVRARWVQNRIDLRRTLSLCRACEAKMPWRWQKRWEYVELTAFHADACPCDYCGETTSVSLFLPEEGDYWQAYVEANRGVHNAWKQELQVAERDDITRKLLRKPLGGRL